MSKYIDSADAVRTQNIRWETVKTEEEEYLDQLQSKLTRVMDGFQSTPLKGADDGLDSSDVMRVSRPVSQQDHDEGLHLMYDYPRSAVDDTSPQQPFPSSSQLPKIDLPPNVDISPSRQRSVRFRSRVRITSGVHSVSSSRGSRSSSISVPLQGPHGPNVSTSTAPLCALLPSEAPNARLSSLSSPRKASSLSSSSRARHEIRNNSASPRSSPVDERTPLASASHSESRRSYTEQVEGEIEEDWDVELDRLRAAARKSEEQVMFGKWPWRLVNRHWWWWKIEPIVCCCFQFDDESDLE